MNNGEHPLEAILAVEKNPAAERRRRKRVTYRLSYWVGLGLRPCGPMQLPSLGCPYYTNPAAKGLRGCPSFQIWRKRRPIYRPVCSMETRLARKLAYLLELRGVEPGAALVLGAGAVGGSTHDRATIARILRGSLVTRRASGAADDREGLDRLARLLGPEQAAMIEPQGQDKRDRHRDPASAFSVNEPDDDGNPPDNWPADPEEEVA